MDRRSYRLNRTLNLLGILISVRAPEAVILKMQARLTGPTERTIAGMTRVARAASSGPVAVPTEKVTTLALAARTVPIERGIRPRFLSFVRAMYRFSAVYVSQVLSSTPRLSTSERRIAEYPAALTASASDNPKHSSMKNVGWFLTRRLLAARSESPLEPAGMKAQSRARDPRRSRLRSNVRKPQPSVREYRGRRASRRKPRDL